MIPLTFQKLCWTIIRSNLSQRIRDIVNISLFGSCWVLKNNQSTGIIHPLDPITATHVFILTENIVQVMGLEC